MGVGPANLNWLTAARSAGESQAPWFWQDLLVAYPFFLGPTGTTIHDVSKLNATAEMADGMLGSDWVTANSHWAGKQPGIDCDTGSINCPIAQIGPPSGDLTIAYGVDDYSGGNNRIVLDWDDTGAGAQQMEIIYNGGNLLCGGGTGGANNREVNAAVSSGMGPHSAAVTRNASDVIQDIWINGLLADDDDSGGLTGPGVSLDIGGRGSTYEFQDIIFYVYIWRRMLTNSEVFQIHQDPTIGFRPRHRVQVVVAGAPPVDVFFENRHPIEQGMKPSTAAGMGGVLVG